MTITARSIIWWIFLAIFCIGVFLVSQWLIPILFHLVGVSIPDQIVNILALLIALGIFFGGFSWRAGPVA